MIRRVKIEADNVGGLRLKVGIPAQHVTAQPVRLRPWRAQIRETVMWLVPSWAGQSTAAPLGCSVLRSTTGALQNSRSESSDTLH